MDNKDKKKIKGITTVTFVAILISIISISIAVKQSNRVKELDAMFIEKANSDLKVNEYENLEKSISEKEAELHELYAEADSIKEDIRTKTEELRKIEDNIDEIKEQKEDDNTSAIQVENANNSMQEIDKALSSDEIDVDSLVDKIINLDGYDEKLKEYETLIDTYSKEAEAYALKYKDNDYIQNLAEELSNDSMLIMCVKDIKETISNEDMYIDKEYLKNVIDDSLKYSAEYKERLDEQFKYIKDYAEYYEDSYSSLLEEVENEKEHSKETDNEIISGFNSER